MGRHAAPDPVDEPDPRPGAGRPPRPAEDTATGAAGPATPQDVDEPGSAPIARWQVWAERAVLGLISAGGTLPVARWAGAAWSTSAWIAAAVLVVVPLAAWVAATVPDDHGSGNRRPGF